MAIKLLNTKPKPHSVISIMKSSLFLAFLFTIFAATLAIKLPSRLSAALPPSIANVLKTPEAKSDDSSTVTVNGLKLVIFNATASKDAAAEACTKVGSGLPIIHSSEELETIKSAVSAGSEIWLGLTKKNDQLEWTDGTAMDFPIAVKEGTENQMCSECGYALDIDSGKLVVVNKSSEKTHVCMKKKDGSAFGLSSIPTLFTKLTTDIQNRIEKMKSETQAQLNKLTEGNEGIMGMLASQQKMMQEILSKMGSEKEQKDAPSVPSVLTSPATVPEEALPTPASEVKE